jgi:hypothetical protein
VKSFVVTAFIKIGKTLLSFNDHGYRDFIVGFILHHPMMENELMLMSQNSMAHAVETHMLTASLQRLRMAITGRS